VETNISPAKMLGWTTMFPFEIGSSSGDIHSFSGYYQHLKRSQINSEAHIEEPGFTIVFAPASQQHFLEKISNCVEKKTE